MAESRHGARSQSQRKIKHYCSCGRMFVGNPGWASHKRAHEGGTYPAPHVEISYRRFVEMVEARDR